MLSHSSSSSSSSSVSLSSARNTSLYRALVASALLVAATSVTAISLRRRRRRCKKLSPTIPSVALSTKVSPTKTAVIARGTSDSKSLSSYSASTGSSGYRTGFVWHERYMFLSLYKFLSLSLSLYVQFFLFFHMDRWHNTGGLFSGHFRATINDEERIFVQVFFLLPIYNHIEFEQRTKKK